VISFDGFCPSVCTSAKTAYCGYGLNRRVHFMTSLVDAANLALLQTLKPSVRMPVLFVGHGSPMNAIEDNAWRRSLQAMGTELLADHRHASAQDHP
jgi:hypothetical protein